MLIEIKSQDLDYQIVYDKAIRDDGSLFFPERLTREFLEEQRRTLGSYIFANQYLNEIIPSEDQDFKKSWLKYYDELPKKVYTFAFIDPAISQEKQADFTAVVVVHVNSDGYWFVETARRFKITATDTVSLMFELTEKFKPMCIGVEDVAYQKALMHFLNEEMRRRGTVIPVKGISRGPEKTKETRIRSLVPRFEWGRIFLNRGLMDLEDEYSKFPRSQYDDLMDALSSIETIAFNPPKEREQSYEPNPADGPRYESYYIRRLTEKASRTTEEDYE